MSVSRSSLALSTSKTLLGRVAKPAPREMISLKPKEISSDPCSTDVSYKTRPEESGMLVISSFHAPIKMLCPQSNREGGSRLRLGQKVPDVRTRVCGSGNSHSSVRLANSTPAPLAGGGRVRWLSARRVLCRVVMFGIRPRPSCSKLAR